MRLQMYVALAQCEAHTTPIALHGDTMLPEIVERCVKPITAIQSGYTTKAIAWARGLSDEQCKNGIWGIGISSQAADVGKQREGQTTLAKEAITAPGKNQHPELHQAQPKK